MVLLCKYGPWVISKEVDMNKGPPIRAFSLLHHDVLTVTNFEEEQ